jgi:hypothetical protein
MKNKIALGIIVIAVAAAAAFYIYKPQTNYLTLPPSQNAYVPKAPDVVKPTRVLLNVPFTSQAPNGNWSDPRQEDGCEEASIYMAWLWIQGKSTSASEAEQAILDMSDFETKNYGNYNDLNAQDTAKLMQDYYGYKKLLVKIEPTLDDIFTELSNGHLVLVPTNGQRLGNPHYKQPGPTTHMLVVKGFDSVKQVFITNDPGTQFGNGYEYKYETLYNAIINYPSGDHEDQTGQPKAMIVVTK